VDLDRREVQLLDDLRVGDLRRLIEGHALDHLGRERARRDRRSAAERLELRVGDQAVLDANLETHDVAARRCADEARADLIGRDVGFRLERADVAGVLVMVDDLL
jgi:hypothetical protein